MNVGDMTSLGVDDLAGLRIEAIRFGSLDLENLDPPELSRFGVELDPLKDRLWSWAKENVGEPALIAIRTTANSGSNSEVDPLVSNDGFVFTMDRRIWPLRLVGADVQPWLVAIREKAGEDPYTMALRASGWSMSGGRNDTFDTDLGEWLEDRAPEKVFFAERLAQERSDYLADAIATAGPPWPFDRMALATAWTSLAATLEEPPAPAATPAEIDAFEAATGIPMPGELRALLELANGAPAAFNGQFLGVEGIISGWESWKQIYDDWTLEELLEFGSDGDLTRGIYTMPRWIPFSDDFCGNHYYIDLAPGPGGVVGQVIRSGADYDSVSRLAPSLTAFLVDELSKR